MKVSVIIPCFNAENHIQECLESIFIQSHRDLEIICMNDGSTDNTRNLVESIKTKSPFEIILINQVNEGAQYSRNAGAQKATGEYFQFLDADDVLLEDKLKVQIELIESNDFPAIVVGSYIRQDNSGKELNRKILTQKIDFNVWDALLKTELGITSANLFKAVLFDDELKWNANYKHSQEYELMFQILQKDETVVFDSNPNTIRRIGNSKTISSNKEMDKWADYVRLRLDILSHLQQNRRASYKPGQMQLLFDAIRMYYPFNPEMAVQAFRQGIPKNFKPSVSMSTSKGYVILFRLFGFEMAEKIRAIMSRRNS